MNDEILKLIIEFKYKSTWCVLGDCNQPQCHHCFPVKNCSENHSYCKENGTCEEYSEFIFKKITNQPK